MATRWNYDTAARLIVITDPPTGGVSTVDVRDELYSRSKDDWRTDSNLFQFNFPFEPIGGQTVSAGQLGATFLLKYGWKIQPYDTAHTLQIVGNLYTDDGSELIVDTASVASVRVNFVVSTLVELRETDVSGLTPTESSELTLVRKALTNDDELSDGQTGNYVIYDDDGVTPLITKDVKDKDGNDVVLTPGVPASRTS